MFPWLASSRDLSATLVTPIPAAVPSWITITRYEYSTVTRARAVASNAVANTGIVATTTATTIATTTTTATVYVHLPEEDLEAIPAPPNLHHHPPYRAVATPALPVIPPPSATPPPTLWPWRIASAASRRCAPPALVLTVLVLFFAPLTPI